MKNDLQVVKKSGLQKRASKRELQKLASEEAIAKFLKNKTNAMVVRKLRELQASCPGGIDCLACDQHVEPRRRPLSARMLQGLVRIYAYFESRDADPWVHVMNHLKKWQDETSINGDMVLMRYWGLLEARKPKNPSDGHYRITDLGKDFVMGKAMVPAWKVFYNRDELQLHPDSDKAPLVSVHEVAIKPVKGKIIIPDYRKFVVKTLRKHGVKSTPRLKLFKFPKAPKVPKEKP